MRDVRMIDVGDKAETRREAEAEAVLCGDPLVLRALWEGKLPKGEAVPSAQVAGVLAAKRTPDLLPMCHPIRLDSVEVHLNLENDRIVIRAYARTHDRTGVEMEALTAASVTALTLYDWAKAHDPTMEFSVRLIRKSGGKSGVWEREPRAATPEPPPLQTVRSAVLTISDRASQGIYSDESGTLIQHWLKEQGAEVVSYALVPDDPEQIRTELVRLADTLQPDLILTTGGTGPSPRDVTPEATRAIVEREVDSITDWLRLQTGRLTPLAYLSRATAGVRGRTLVVNLPGSPRAVQEHLTALLPLLPHAIRMVQGGGHSHEGAGNG